MKHAPGDADEDSYAATLAAKYKKLLDERDSREWPRLFDSDWRDTVLESQDSLLLWAPRVASAVECFIAEYGRPPRASNRRRWRPPSYVEKALCLLQSLQPPDGAALAAVRHIRVDWLEFAADAQSARIVAPDPIDLLVETEGASGRGKRSGAARRAKSEKMLKDAAAALSELRQKNALKHYTLADIEAKLNKQLPKRATLVAIEARVREKVVKK